MPSFVSSFKCKGTRDQPPMKNHRENDVYQLRTIFNRWTKDSKDGQEFFEIEYWEGKNGVYQRLLHLGSDVRGRYPSHVNEWEKKHLEDWKRVYAAKSKIFTKNDQNLPKEVNPLSGGVGSSRNKGNVDGKEKSMTSETPQDQVSVQNKLKRAKLSHSDGAHGINNSMPPMIPSSRSDASKPLPPASTSRSNTSDILKQVPNARSNLILAPKVPSSLSNGSMLPLKVPASRPDLMASSQVPISLFNGSMLPSHAQVSSSLTNVSKIPLYKPGSLPVNSTSQSRGRMIRQPRRFLRSRNIYRSEITDDEIEDPDQLKLTSNESRVGSNGMSVGQSRHSVPNRSEDEMDIVVEPTAINQTRHDVAEADEMEIDVEPTETDQIHHDKADEMDLDVEPPDQTHQEGSGDLMDIDSDPSSNGIEALNETFNDIVQDRYIDEYQEGMGGHVEAIYQTSQSDLMQVVTNATDGNFENEGIPAIGEPVDPDSDLPVSSAGKLFYEYSEKLIQAHSKGLVELIMVALNLKGFPCDKWVSKRTDVKGGAYIHFINALIIMLAGIDKRILKHLVEGNLSSVVRQPGNYDLSSKLNNMKAVLAGETKLTHRPYIYIQYLVDRSGISPNPEDVGKFLDYVELYLRGFNIRENQDSHQCALKIDTAFYTSKHGYGTAQAGYRRYASSDRNPRSSTWKKTILQWVETTRDRLRHSNQDEPLSRPLVEVGYATALSRLDEHKSHTGSNYIMNLVEAICKAYFSERWSIKQYVLFKVAHHTHAMFGEILCTRLAQAYTTHSGGFCHHAAGISLGAVHKLDALYWRRVQRELLNENRGFWDNMRDASLQLQETTLACKQAIQERKDTNEAIARARTQLALDMTVDWDEKFKSMSTSAREITRRMNELLRRIEEQRERKRNAMMDFINAMAPLRPLIELANVTNEEKDIQFNNN